MEIKQIKDLMAAMSRTGTKRLTLKKEGFELQLEQVENHSYPSSEHWVESTEDNPMRLDMELHRARAFLKGAVHGVHPAKQPVEEEVIPASPRVEESKGVFITSPMVGTFYLSPSPDDPSFVKEGDQVDKNTVVCIVEAMKVMNEVKAGLSGVIAEVLVESGQPIEFGSKLFRIIPGPG